MSRCALLLPLAAALAFAACGDRDAVTLSPPGDAATATTAPANARERLASRLAVALDDPALRAELARRFEASRAPEGKLQFQTLAKADNNRLLARLAATGGGTVRDLLADLDAARDLELYLPVASQRAAWHGDAGFLVATAGDDGERPVAYDAAGHRSLLSATRPPDIPVIALMPQETDFTRPSFMMCNSDDCAGGGGGGGGQVGGSADSRPTGLYLVAANFDEDHESWFKGAPEFEVHIYGEVGGKAKLLACTGEHSGGPYYWNSDALGWRGSAAMLTQQDLEGYLRQNSKGVIRIVAWEDDDEPCVTHTDGNFLGEIIKVLDDAVQVGHNGGRLDPTFIKGVHQAWSPDLGPRRGDPSFIKGSDDFTRGGDREVVVGWAPGTANLVLKGEAQSDARA